MPRTPEEMFAVLIKNMPAKTGKTLDEWKALVAAQGPESRKDRINWLKENHGMGHVYAQVVADSLVVPDWVGKSPEELLAAQYAKEKAPLLPIYERVVSAVRSLGDDTRVEPRKTYVAFSRQRQFGIVQATTRDRVTVGLALGAVPFGGRLVPSGSIGNERITHRVDLARPEDVDEELQGWLKAAYEEG